MSNRRKRGQVEDKFATTETPASLSMEEAANRGYNTLNLKTARTVKARYIAIDETFPDPTQPRRAVPLAIRGSWDGSPGTTSSLFRAWIEAMSKEVGLSFDDTEEMIQSALRGHETYRTDESGIHRTGVAERSLLGIVDLAASIRRDGLINPITVASEENRYRIETGERRWLAYQLLAIYDGDKWDAIPAREVDHVDVWKQAFENNVRQDLNAIGIARQIAALLMSLYRERGSVFRPYGTFENDRDYYAQVADGNRWRVPRGEGERLLQAVGLKHIVQVSQYRSLLSLPDFVWEVADDLDWPEGKLRNLTPPCSPADAVRTACTWLRREGYALSGISPCEEIAAAPVREVARESVIVSRMRRGLTPLTRLQPDSVVTLSDTEKAKVEELISEYEMYISRIREWLD